MNNLEIYLKKLFFRFDQKIKIMQIELDEQLDEQLDERKISNVIGYIAWDARESLNKTSTYIKMNYSRETR